MEITFLLGVHAKIINTLLNKKYYPALTQLLTEKKLKQRTEAEAFVQEERNPPMTYFDLSRRLRLVSCNTIEFDLTGLPLSGWLKHFRVVM